MGSAEKLLTGSKKINEKRDEIDKVLKDVTSALKRYDFPKVRIPTPDGGNWEVKCTDRDYPQVDYLGHEDGRDTWLWMYRGPHPIPGPAVVRVHEALDAFVDGMCKKFPRVQKALQHVFEAAES